MNPVDLAPEFSFLIDEGFLPVSKAYRPQEFGNASIILEGPAFSLRLLRDRNDVSVDIGNDSLGWYKFEYVLEFIDPSITQSKLGEPPDLGAMAALLRQKRDHLTKLFNDRKQLADLKRFIKQKSAELVAKIFPSHKVR